jgi:hypothetical protein
VSAEFARYEEFLRRELPPLVRNKLVARIDEVLDPIEETLKSELVDIVHDLQLQLFRTYQQQSQASRETTGLAEAGDGETPEGFGTLQNSGGQAELLAAYCPVPNYVNSFGGFNGLMFDFKPLTGSDSGYGSNEVYPFFSERGIEPPVSSP